MCLFLPLLRCDRRTASEREIATIVPVSDLSQERRDLAISKEFMGGPHQERMDTGDRLCAGRIKNHRLRILTDKIQKDKRLLKTERIMEGREEPLRAVSK